MIRTVAQGGTVFINCALIKGIIDEVLYKADTIYLELIVSLKDKTMFGVNFGLKENLQKHRTVWINFIGPVVLIFVELSTKKCWWADLNDRNSYNSSDYLVKVDMGNRFDLSSLKQIKKLGTELFVTQELIEIIRTMTKFKFWILLKQAGFKIAPV